jgi:hypothetical protein
MSEEYRGLTPTVYMVPISIDFMYTNFDNNDTSRRLLRYNIIQRIEIAMDLNLSSRSQNTEIY